MFLAFLAFLIVGLGPQAQAAPTPEDLAFQEAETLILGRYTSERDGSRRYPMAIATRANLNPAVLKDFLERPNLPTRLRFILGYLSEIEQGLLMSAAARNHAERIQAHQYAIPQSLENLHLPEDYPLNDNNISSQFPDDKKDLEMKFAAFADTCAQWIGRAKVNNQDRLTLYSYTLLLTFESIESTPGFEADFFYPMEPIQNAVQRVIASYPGDRQILDNFSKAALTKLRLIKSKYGKNIRRIPPSRWADVTKRARQFEPPDTIPGFHPEDFFRVQPSPMEPANQNTCEGQLD